VGATLWGLLLLETALWIVKVPAFNVGVCEVDGNAEEMVHFGASPQILPLGAARWPVDGCALYIGVWDLKGKVGVSLLELLGAALWPFAAYTLDVAARDLDGDADHVRALLWFFWKGSCEGWKVGICNDSWDGFCKRFFGGVGWKSLRWMKKIWDGSCDGSCEGSWHGSGVGI